MPGGDLDHKDDYDKWKWTTYLPHGPTVQESVMGDFLTEACKHIEAAGFASTVGHRFFSDLNDLPTGTKPQFHYYAQAVPLGDPGDIPDATGEVFIGEIGASTSHGKPWPALKGRDANDAKSRIFERLKHVARKGYKLALVWPDLAWWEVDPMKIVPPGRDRVVTWDEFAADPIDPLELSSGAQEGVSLFTHGLFRDGVPDPLPDE
jgi:hypothetical protein